MSKMGISTYQSYCGAQIFDAVGLKSDFVDKYFTGTATRIEGVGLAEIAEETVRRHRDAFGDAPIYAMRSMSAAITRSACAARTTSGRADGVARCSMRCAAIRRAVSRVSPRVNEQIERLLTIRGLFRLKTREEDGRKPVPLEEVEPAKEIVKRFATGAMSFGSISREAHTTLAIADEPHRRQVEHRRGRRGGRPLQAAAERRFDALGDQAGGLGPLRRDDRVPRQLRHDADQDGAGRQARRRRPAARPQGRQESSPRCAIRRRASA